MMTECNEWDTSDLENTFTENFKHIQIDNKNLLEFASGLKS